MGTRELLSYLEKLEIGLSSFSYEELGIVEAGELKKSFEIFKHGLEDKVFGVSEMKQLEDIYQKLGISGSVRNMGRQDEASQLSVLIMALEQTPLTHKQHALVKAIKAVAQQLAKNNNDSPEHMPQNYQCIEKSLDSSFSAHKINLKPVLEDCMGQMDLLEELVRMFKQNALEFIGSIKVHLLNEDIASVQLACQKLGPNLKMMKTGELFEIVQQMASMSTTEPDIRLLSFLYDQFVLEYPLVQEQVDFEMEMFRAM